MPQSSGRKLPKSGGRVSQAMQGGRNIRNQGSPISRGIQGENEQCAEAGIVSVARRCDKGFGEVEEVIY